MRLLTILIICLFCASCQTTQTRTELPQKREHETLLRTDDNGWLANEKLVRLNLLAGQSNLHRKGITQNGNTYSYSANGTGSVSSMSKQGLLNAWTIECKTDKIDDKRSCEITNFEAGLFVAYSQSLNPTRVCVWFHDFPGQFAFIRVDKNEAIATNENGCISASRIHKSLLSGGQITTRGVKWPKEVFVDKQLTLNGFSDAVLLMSFIGKSVDPSLFQ